ncbi:ATG27 domain-containing protein [Rhizoctonia solani AG-1 IA]|uniref:ATG27 domain-containing protein n=1 Tax=Thanatephorus cucumeris (strain AG1-IA) TaxID=983506 RepID=L8WLJ4_THACA|nr:ATG27 domain-containing protein [Rhizoctonia solani AG-1 IA]
MLAEQAETPTFAKPKLPRVVMGHRSKHVKAHFATMILPWRQHAFLFLISITLALAQESSFKCDFEFDKVKYDMHLMDGEWVVKQDRATPPTTMQDELRFNVCGDLKKQAEVKDRDQFSVHRARGHASGRSTERKKRMCATQDRVVSVIPVAQSSTKFTIDRLPSDRGKGIIITMNAGSYPSEGGKPQSLKLALICVDKTEEPRLIGYDGSQVSAEWKAVEACGSSKSSDVDAGGSSMGWFFFINALSLEALVVSSIRTTMFRSNFSGVPTKEYMNKGNPLTGDIAPNVRRSWVSWSFPECLLVSSTVRKGGGMRHQSLYLAYSTKPVEWSALSATFL